MDDDDVNDDDDDEDDDFDVRKSVAAAPADRYFVRIIYMSGFRIPSRILRLLLNLAANMRSFSLYPILQSPRANS